jgi:hypothetical protein
MGNFQNSWRSILNARAVGTPQGGVTLANAAGLD